MEGRQGEKTGIQRSKEHLWRQGQNGARPPANDTGATGGKMQTRGVDIEQDAISRIESGDRLVTDYELRAFAAIFDTTIEDLLEPEG